MFELTFAIDPHVHSNDSHDGHEPIELVLEHAADIGLDGVVITDHDAIGESRRAAEIAPDYGLVGIPGVEVSTRHGHLLAIGVDERPPPRRPLARTVERVRELGGVAIVPHPFQRSRHGVKKRHLRDVDAVEVYNSMLFTGYRNRRANTFAERRGFPMIGASDAHYLPNVGRAYTEITIDPGDGSIDRADVDGELLVDAMRNGRTTIRGRRTPIHASARQYARGAITKTANGAVTKTAYVVTSRTRVASTIPAWMDRP